MSLNLLFEWLFRSIGVCMFGGQASPLLPLLTELFSGSAQKLQISITKFIVHPQTPLSSDCKF